MGQVTFHISHCKVSTPVPFKPSILHLCKDSEIFSKVFVYHRKALSEIKILWITLFIHSRMKTALSQSQYLETVELTALLSVPFIDVITGGNTA